MNATMRALGVLVAFSAVLGGACAGRSVAVEVPSAAPALGPTELAAWTSPPAPAADVVRRLPLAIRRATLDNGVHVTVVARPGTSTTAIALRVPSMRDSSTGPVAVMAAALRAGTRQAGDEMLINPKLGQGIGIETSNTGTTFTWEVLPRASATAVRLLGAFVLSPAFNPPDVAVWQHQADGHILRYSTSIARLHDVVHSAFHGLERPTPEEDRKGLVKLTPAVLRAVHSCTLRPEGVELVVAGPISFEEVHAWAQAAFGGWRAARRSDDPACAAWLLPPAPAHPEQARLSRMELRIVYGRFDPEVVISVLGPDPTSDDYLTFGLLGQILAGRGAGASRALRDLGATYGIHGASHDDYAHLSLFDLSGQVDPEAAQDSLRKLLADIHTIADNLEGAELSRAVRRWRNEVIDSLASNRAAAEWALWQLRRGHEVSALPELLDEIGRVDLARCRDVGHRWLSAAQPSVGLMGLGRFERGLDLDVHVRRSYWERAF